METAGWLAGSLRRVGRQLEDGRGRTDLRVSKEINEWQFYSARNTFTFCLDHFPVLYV